MTETSQKKTCLRKHLAEGYVEEGTAVVVVDWLKFKCSNHCVFALELENNKFFFPLNLSHSSRKQQQLDPMIGRTWQREVFSESLNPSQVGAVETAFRKVRAEAPSKTSRWSLNTKLPVICSTDLRFWCEMLWDVVRCCEMSWCNCDLYFIFCLEFWELKFHIEQTSRMDLQPSSRGENLSRLNWEGSHDTDAAWDVPNMKNTSNWRSTLCNNCMLGALLKHYILIIFDTSFIRNYITVGFLASTCEMILVGGAAEVVPKCTVEWYSWQV